MCVCEVVRTVCIRNTQRINKRTLRTCGMSIVPLVVRHVHTHRVIRHGFHVVNSHVTILLLVAEHRILTCSKHQTNMNEDERRVREREGLRSLAFLSPVVEYRRGIFFFFFCEMNGRYTKHVNVAEDLSTEIYAHISKGIMSMREPANKKTETIAKHIIVVKPKKREIARILVFCVRHSL